MTVGLTKSDRLGQGKVFQKSFATGVHFGAHPTGKLSSVFPTIVGSPLILCKNPYVDRQGQNCFEPGGSCTNQFFIFDKLNEAFQDPKS